MVCPAAVLVLTAPPAAAAAEAFASVPPQRFFVERVAGEHARVQALVRPGESPATYDPSPQQMAALSSAELFFRIGVPFERSWVARIQAANPRMEMVDLSEGLALRRLEEGQAGHDHGPGGHGESAPIDPHVWTSPPLVVQMTERIARVLARHDPDHAADYRRNAESFIAELKALDREIRHVLEVGRGRAFLVYHPAWGYFAEAYGLTQVAIEAAGREPGPRALAATIERSRENDVRVIFVQPQFSRSNAETVARAIGAEVVAVDPLAEDYLTNMRRVADAFARALR
jgi:zinc transport system substrate-binding protein